MHDDAVRLSSSLTALSQAATEILGYPVHADLCGGEELEFRRCDEDGYGADDFSCIRPEEVIEKIREKRNGKQG